MTTTKELAAQECVPCQGEVPPLRGAALKKMRKQLGGAWKVVKEHHLEREFKFPDFRKALEFTNRVGKLAEKAGHHPDIFLSWGKVVVQIWTHKTNGLTVSDFVLAARISGAA